MKYYVHIMNLETAAMIAQRVMAGVPRVDDELRLGHEETEAFWRVTNVIWCLNETHPGGMERVNIAVIPI